MGLLRTWTLLASVILRTKLQDRKAPRVPFLSFFGPNDLESLKERAAEVPPTFFIGTVLNRIMAGNERRDPIEVRLVVQIYYGKCWGSAQRFEELRDLILSSTKALGTSVVLGNPVKNPSAFEIFFNKRPVFSKVGSYHLGEKPLILYSCSDYETCLVRPIQSRLVDVCIWFQMELSSYPHFETIVDLACEVMERGDGRIRKIYEVDSCLKFRYKSCCYVSWNFSRVKYYMAADSDCKVVM